MKKLFLTLFLCIFLISFASAQIFPQERLAPSLKENIVISPSADLYPSISLKDWFGLGGSLVDLVLTEHTAECGSDCMSQFQIKTYGDGALIDDVNFYTINEKGDEILQPIRGYKFEILGGYKQVTTDNYIKSCSIIGRNINGSDELKCTYENKPMTIEVENWVSYNLGDILPADTYQIRLTGNKLASRTVDWKIKTQGLEIGEWSIWGAGVLGAGQAIEWYNATDDDSWPVYPPLRFCGQGFTIGTSTANATYQICNVSLKVGKYGTVVGTTTIAIGWMDVNTRLPNGTYITQNTSVLASGFSETNPTTGWHNINLPCFNATANGAYIIIANSSTTDSTNNMIWASKDADPAGYLGGNFTSFIGGVWATTYGGYTTSKFQFQIFGNTFASESLVTINSPANLYTTNTNPITFNCSATVVSGANLTNISLLDNSSGTWKVNQTTSLTGVNNQTVFTNNYVDGSYLWNCMGGDSDGVSGMTNANRTFTIDSINPSINVIYPTGTISSLTNAQNLTLNYSISDIHLQSCWYEYNLINYSIGDCTKNASFIYSSGVNSIKVWSNDSFGNRNFNSSNWGTNLITNSFTFNSSTYESTIEGFTANVTTGNIISSVNLIYNGTSYPANFNQIGSNAILNHSIYIPYVNPVNANTSFYFNIIFTNGSVNTSSNIQLVQKINISSISISGSGCGVGYSLAFYFDFKNEENLTTLTGVSANYILQYGFAGNTSAVINSGNLSSTNNFSICILSSSPTFNVGYGEIQYSLSNYVPRRFYIFSNTHITNVSANNTLYLLFNSAPATAFQITTTDTSLIPYTNNYVGLLRWYPAINSYLIVDMGKTDLQGQTVVYVKTNDVDYRLALYARDGTLLKLLNPIRMVCQTNPCVYSLITSLEELDLTNFGNIQKNLSFNPLTKVFTFIYNDPSQATSLMNLTVYQDTALSNNIICSTSSPSFTGVLVCDVSAYSGTLRAMIYRSASPSKPLDILQIVIRSDFVSAGGGGLGLLFGVILVIFMALIGIVSPVLCVILGLVGLIPLLFLGSISLSVFLGFGVLAGIILHTLGRII